MVVTYPAGDDAVGIHLRSAQHARSQCRLIAYVFPARYFVSLLQTVFLAGNIWNVILPNAAVMAGMAVGLLVLSMLATRKKIG